LPSKQFWEQQSDEVEQLAPMAATEQNQRPGSRFIAVICLMGEVMEATHVPLEQAEPAQHTLALSHAWPSARHAHLPPSQRVPAQHTL
jgi:hypothetical protein